MTVDIYKEFVRKAASYCAYQERTQAEVRERLREWNIFGDDAELIIARLIEENFINEERFAKAFAGGKFRVKNWGKQKIRYELKGRGLSAYNIKTAMLEIDENDYLETLKKLLIKKKNELKGENPLLLKQKMAKYVIGKGFESELVWKIIAEIVKK